MARSRTAAILSAPFRGVKALAEAIFSTPASWHPRGAAALRVERKVGDGGDNSIVVAALGWLQRNFPQAPIRVRERAGDGAWTPIEPSEQGAGRMLTLLEDPNPFYDWSALSKASVLSAILDGNFYWMVVRNGLDAPIAYWWIPHTLIEPKRREGSNEFLTHYEYNPGMGVPVELAPEDVVHYRDGIDPANPLKGRSRVKAVLQEVLTDEEAAAYTASLLVNMGVPGIVASPTADGQVAMQNVSDEDLRTVKAKIDGAVTGSNRGRTVVLDHGMKLDTVGFSPEQMSLRDLRQVPEERITAAIGVPAIVAGMGAGLAKATFANFGEARETAVEEALIPLWNDVSRTIKKRVLPDFVGAAKARQLMVDFDLSEVRVLREDQDKIAQRMSSLVAGGIAKVGEARERMGLPVEDEHNIYLRPLALIEVASGPDAKEEPQPDRTLEYRMAALVNAGMITPNMALERLGFPSLPSGGDELRLPEATAAPEAKAMKAIGVAADEVKRLSRRQQAQLVQQLEKDARALERSFAQRLERAFEALGSLVANTWREESGGKALSEGDQSLVLRTLRKAAVREWQKRNLDPLYTAQYQGVLDQTLDTLSATIGIEIGDVDKLAVDVVREGGTRLGLVDLEAQTKDAMLAAIADGRENGLGPVEIERQIRQFVTDGSPGANVSARAMRIARTETMHAQRRSTVGAYEASGAYASVIAWDDRLGYGDPDCVARNQQEFSFDEVEAEEAEEHPNGTLSWAPGATTE